MIEADRINSTFYAMRLLSHQLALEQIELCEGTQYPASEFTVEEQLSAFEILNILSADKPINELSRVEIEQHLDLLAARIERSANTVLAEAGYETFA